MEPGGPEGGREGAEAEGREWWRVPEPKSRPQRGARPSRAQSRPPGQSRAATPPGSPGTRLRALREGWWRRGAGQRSRQRLPPGRGRCEPGMWLRPPALGPRAPAPALGPRGARRPRRR